MRPTRLLPALALLLAAAPAPAAPAAPPAPAALVDGPAGLTPAQASDFKTALDALAQQGHVCILAEDAPLRPALALKDAPAVPDHTPLSEAVKLVADAYDYDAARTGNVFTLTKRYSDPADLPCVTSEECAEDLHNVVLALSAFDPPAVWGGPTYGDPFRDRIAGILGALTPGQWRAVFSQQGVPVAELGGEARAAVNRWDCGIYLDGPAGIAGRYEAQVAHADRAAVGVSTTEVVDVGPDRPPLGGETAFGQRVWGGPGGFDFRTFDDHPFTTGVTTPAGWAVTPEMLAAARARVARRRADGHESLARAVAALAGRGGHDEVVPALAAKSVTAAGEANADPGAALAGLARVYGLRVRLRQSDGAAVLDLPERVQPADVAGVWAAVRGLVPAPLLRASHLLDGGAPDGRLAQLRQRMAAPGMQPPSVDEQLEFVARLRAQREEPAVVYRAAVWALRVASELYPASAKVNGLLPVSALTADDRALYAAALMLPFLGQVPDLANPGSLKRLTEEEQCVLTAKVYAAPDVRGTWKVDLDLNRPQADGTLEDVGGMGQVEYDGPLPPEAVSPAAAPASTP